ncbi:MAG: hypothetical protein JNN17_14135 [Verrucomicrobiaceae bacterium]|nr:hypothetical protein [Verrucomicrobiaceae bacterium]
MKRQAVLLLLSLSAFTLSSCSQVEHDPIDHPAVLQEGTTANQGGGEGVHRGIFGTTDRRCSEFGWHYGQ